MRAVLIDPDTQSINEVDIGANQAAIDSAAGRALGITYHYANGDLLYSDQNLRDGNSRFEDHERSIFGFGKALLVGANFTDTATTLVQAKGDMGFMRHHPSPEPEYVSIVTAGDVVTVDKPVYMRTSAGGGKLQKLPQGAEITIERVFYDYEAGYRCVGRLVDPAVAAKVKLKLTSEFGPDWYRANKPGDERALLRATEALLNWKPDVCFFPEAEIATVFKPDAGPQP